MAKLMASDDPSQKPCWHWSAGLPCFAGATKNGCPYYHDPAFTEKNICKKWRRNDCKHGVNCCYLHKGPGGPRRGCLPGHFTFSPDEPDSLVKMRIMVTKGITELVRLQMKRDREVLLLDEEARTKKYKLAYERTCHPEKMGRVDTLKECATEISHAIAKEKEWYLGPSPSGTGM